ncbi:CAP domain-containing protein [Kitasatospora sp. NPDC091207]|uniref:CAP domain-containing protein n=1 Tax=Kitasatospora sp. NPDC091207 TaxID=3364083 RepID=UPI00381316ED
MPLPPPTPEAELPAAADARWGAGAPGNTGFDAWRELFRGYRDVCRVPVPDARAEPVRSWLADPAHGPAHESERLLVRATAGTPVGLARHRPFVRPLHGAAAGCPDDLFVGPAVRGADAVDALLARLRAIAAGRGWSAVRWITAADHHRARGTYDQVATRTMCVTYDPAPDAAGRAGSGARSAGGPGGSEIRSYFLLSARGREVSQVSAPGPADPNRKCAQVNSEDRTTILPAAGGSGAPGGRAARRAADRHRGRGRRGRRRRGIGPVLAVAAAVAGTGVLAALGGAGYVVYGDRDGQQALALDPQIAAEAGDHNGIQVPGAGFGAPALPPTPSDSPSAGDAAHAASATPVPTAAATAGQSPSAGAATASASAPATASGRPTSAGTTAATASTVPKASASSAASPGRTTAAPTSGATGGGSTAQQVVDLVNVQRAQHGCGPLTADSRLATAAQGHSEDMAARDYFDHASPEGYHADHRIEATGYRWNSWGENIARGQKDPAAVMDAWMNSPGHRANILNCSFKEIGVGVKTGSGGPWWTQVFASPS